MAWPLRRVFRLFWWFLCTLTILALPLTIWEFSSKAWFIGGILVILSIPISVYEVAMHTEYYTQPRLQRHVIRILWMVPIYGVDAWLALRFRDARLYLDPIRECYEAYVIYNFYAYLMAYLEDTVGNLEAHLAKKPPMQHIPVVRWIVPPWPMGAKFLLECKKGILNFVIMRPLCTALGLITNMYDLYGEGQIDFSKSYVYLAGMTNFSQVWALYCLAMMYHKMHKELAPIRPLAKFIVVKAVVFVTFWQGVIIAILVYKGVISRDSWTTYDQLNVASGIQDFLICIEMFVAALAHAYAFPPREYMDPNHPKASFFTNVRHMFDLRDVMEDMSQVVEGHASTVVGTASATTSTVMRLPHRALSVAVSAPASLLGLLTRAGQKKAIKRDLEEGEESRLALLTPEEQDVAGGLASAGGSGGGHGGTVGQEAHGAGSTGQGSVVEPTQGVPPRPSLHSRKASGSQAEGLRVELPAVVTAAAPSKMPSGSMNGDGMGGSMAGLAGRMLRGSGTGTPDTQGQELQQRGSPIKADLVALSLSKPEGSFGSWTWGVRREDSSTSSSSLPERSSKAE